MADKYKLIACEVFKMSLEMIISLSENDIDIEYLDKEAHNDSDDLNRQLTAAISRAESVGQYEAILLAYGLCGNSTKDLQSSSIPLVIPRAHDCCTIFLGSRELFTKHFKDNPSCPFTSPGYAAAGSSMLHESTVSEEMYGDGRSWNDLVEKYGEENAAYVRDMLQVEIPGRNKIIYVNHRGDNSDELEDTARQKAREEGIEFIKIEGSDRLLDKLINGFWDEEFLIVSPGKKIHALYDWEEIIRAD